MAEGGGQINFNTFKPKQILMRVSFTTVVKGVTDELPVTDQI